MKELKKHRKNKKTVQKTVVLTLALLLVHVSGLAQLFCEYIPATTDGSGIQEYNRLLDAIIIGVAIITVLITFILSAKYLFKPEEHNPDHIKNIIKDEGF